MSARGDRWDKLARLLRFHAAYSSISSQRGRTHEVEPSLARVFFPTTKTKRLLLTFRSAGRSVAASGLAVGSDLPSPFDPDRDLACGSPWSSIDAARTMIAWQQFLPHDWDQLQLHASLCTRHSTSFYDFYLVDHQPVSTVHKVHLQKFYQLVVNPIFLFIWFWFHGHFNCCLFYLIFLKMWSLVLYFFRK
jgi:hypothetical protein